MQKRERKRTHTVCNFSFYMDIEREKKKGQTSVNNWCFVVNNNKNCTLCTHKIASLKSKFSFFLFKLTSIFTLSTVFQLVIDNPYRIQIKCVYSFVIEMLLIGGMRQIFHEQNQNSVHKCHACAKTIL